MVRHENEAVDKEVHETINTVTGCIKKSTGKNNWLNVKCPGTSHTRNTQCGYNSVMCTKWRISVIMVHHNSNWNCHYDHNRQSVL